MEEEGRKVSDRVTQRDRDHGGRRRAGDARAGQGQLRGAGKALGAFRKGNSPAGTLILTY